MYISANTRLDFAVGTAAVLGVVFWAFAVLFLVYAIIRLTWMLEPVAVALMRLTPLRRSGSGDHGRPVIRAVVHNYSRHHKGGLPKTFNRKCCNWIWGVEQNNSPASNFRQWASWSLCSGHLRSSLHLTCYMADIHHSMVTSSRQCLLSQLPRGWAPYR